MFFLTGDMKIFRVLEIAINFMDFELVTLFSGYVPGPVLNMKKQVRVSAFIKGPGLSNFHWVTSSIL